MAKIYRTKTSEGSNNYFNCPGCGITHGFNNNWNFNQDYDKPTISPSILVRGYSSKGKEIQCHSYITDGNIQFLNDCNHELAGKTVELPEIEI